MIEWDRNKDGGIDSKEFRICMRGLGGHLKDIDVREIDGLFETLDTDHSGEISIKELKSAIKRMQQESRMRATEAARSRNTAQKLTTAAELFRDAAAQKADLEESEMAVHSMENDRSLDARLGDLLHMRNVKIGEVVTKWDKDGGGSVDANEFYLRTKEMGLVAEKAEVKDLFNRLDDDGSGELEVDELKVCLKKLQDAALQATEDVKKQKKRNQELAKVATTTQLEVQEALAKVRAEIAAEEEAAREALKVKAEEEARKKAEALAAEKEAKAARQAKVAASHANIGWA